MKKKQEQRRAARRETPRETNLVAVKGRVEQDFTYSHIQGSERFYTGVLRVDRLSDSTDLIPLTVSERLVDPGRSYYGACLEVEGQLRSYNQHVDHVHHLRHSVFAQSLMVSEEEHPEHEDQVYLDGYVSSAPFYKETPSGRRITEVMLAVNRCYGRADYIPCICWGRNACFAAGLALGTHVLVWGRIQSRDYLKRVSQDTTEQRRVHEVSVSWIEKVKEES